MSTKKLDLQFFNDLCVDYYEKILRYCYAKLNSEAAARDCTQDVFLVALQKKSILRQHPNAAGFLFQTAKNLVRERQRLCFRQMMAEVPIQDDSGDPMADLFQVQENALDKLIDEEDYIENVMSQLSEEKQYLYSLYYIEKKSMREISEIFNIAEAAVRMRYVRLRKEIHAIVAEVAQKYFIS